MPDDLRTRIAQVLHRIYGPSLGCSDHSWDREPSGLQDVYLSDADAVIRELAGSDCIYRYACHRCGDFWFDKSERMQRFALLHGKAHADE